MELRRNLFLKGLQEDRSLLGCWLGIPDASVAEIAAGAGYDWLLIDHEHAAFEVCDVLSHLRAMAPYPVEPIVRPVDDDPALLKKLLEIGTQTFLVPMIDSAEQAQACVQAVYFPPVGNRGVGSSLARAARWNQVEGYLSKANNEICLLVQAESVKALENLDEILQVDGIHGVFIGPSDLAASMGFIGKPSAAEVVKEIDRAIKKIRAAGKAAGILSLDPEMIAFYRESGANFVGVGVDTLLIAQGFKDRLQEARGMNSRKSN